MRKKDERRPLRMVILITQLGINMLVPIFICAWLGIRAVEILENDIWFPVVLLLGILAGFRSCYMTVCRFVPMKNKTEKTDVREGTGKKKLHVGKDGESYKDESDKTDK